MHVRRKSGTDFFGKCSDSEIIGPALVRLIFQDYGFGVPLETINTRTVICDTYNSAAQGRQISARGTTAMPATVAAQRCMECSDGAEVTAGHAALRRTQQNQCAGAGPETAAS